MQVPQLIPAKEGAAARRCASDPFPLPPPQSSTALPITKPRHTDPCQPGACRKIGVHAAGRGHLCDGNLAETGRSRLVLPSVAGAGGCHAHSRCPSSMIPRDGLDHASVHCWMAAQQPAKAHGLVGGGSGWVRTPRALHPPTRTSFYALLCKNRGVLKTTRRPRVCGAQRWVSLRGDVAEVASGGCRFGSLRPSASLRLGCAPYSSFPNGFLSDYAAV